MLKKLDLQVNGVTWHLRELKANEKLNAQSAGGTGDIIIAMVCAGIVGADGLEIPKDREARTEWANEYFTSRIADLSEISVAIAQLSSVSAEGKEPSVSAPA